MIKGTIRLYVEVIGETGGALLRGPFVWLMLLVMPVVILMLATLLSPLGMIGGFAVGFAVVYLYGAYLYAVGQCVERRLPLGTAIIKESMGQHIWDVMNVAFIHWIVSLAFRFGSLPDVIPMALSLVAFVLFNPWPEVIHTERVQGAMDTLVRSFRFMQANGPEWVAPHLLLFVMGAGVVMVPGDLQPAMALGSGLLLHPLMVFRAVLYRKLSSGSRRSRSWTARF
jgi:hypothetical protein